MKGFVGIVCFKKGGCMNFTQEKKLIQKASLPPAFSYQRSAKNIIIPVWFPITLKDLRRALGRYYLDVSAKINSMKSGKVISDPIYLYRIIKN